MSETAAATGKPGLARVLGLWSLIVYGIVLIQPTAPMSPFGVVSVRPRALMNPIICVIANIIWVNQNGGVGGLGFGMNIDLQRLNRRWACSSLAPTPARSLYRRMVARHSSNR